VITSSGLERGVKPPALLFAAGSLSRGGGGIAELSRQVLKTLLDMQRDRLLELEVHVLDDAGPADDEDLFEVGDLPAMRWYAGKRWKFVVGLLMTRPDVLLFDHVGLARLQGLIPSWSVPPYLLLIHSVEIWNNNRADYHRTARRASLLIANSKYTTGRARNHYPDLPEIVVCWPGKAPLSESGPGEDCGVDDIGPHAMLIVGRLDTEQRHKGHDHLIEAMHLILKEVPDAQLVIAGGGDDRHRLEEKSKSLGLTENILFLGRVAEAQLTALYSRCALFVLPSDGDGFGLVFLEAMMHRLPCVGLEQGAAAEIFADGESGVLVDRDDLPGMANCLASLLLDEARRKELGGAGYERYRNQFTERHHSERLQSILMTHLGL
jgi:phosphatidylinositol alpha-1,6-mannosyltransferase